MINPNKYIKTYEDLNEYQKRTMTSSLKKNTRLPEDVIGTVVERMEGFSHDEFNGAPEQQYIGAVYFSRVKLLSIYGLITIKLENNTTKTGDL